MLKRDEINIRDTFVLLHDEKYYMYGTRSQTTWGPASGFDVYVSDDLDNWQGPIEIFENDGSFWATQCYWAPECFHYQGSFYFISTFGSQDRNKGIQILKAETPIGPFIPMTEFPVTPVDWNCIDGTLYVDDAGTPWLIYSHGLLEEPRGALCVQQLAKDLSATVSEPVDLFYADAARWAKPIPFAKSEFGLDGDVYLSDGPYIFYDNGLMTMLWSSWGVTGYSMGLAVSENNNILGPWQVHQEPIFTKDGGHGMIFHTKDDRRMLALHSPNEKYKERPMFIDITDGFEVIG